MKCAFFSLTDTGRVRANNEDALAIVPEAGLVVLADGMGGYNAGEVASALATETVVAHLTTPTSQLQTGRSGLTQAVMAAMHAANQAVFNAAQSHDDHRGMATTLVTGVFIGARLAIGHVGDSRVYRFRQGHLVRLTRDHSLLQEQVDAGLISPELARLAQHKNLVTRAVGVAPSVDIEVQELVVQPGDTYLFCSDGLNDMLTDAEMAAILRHHPPLEHAARALLDRANAAGGRDNISLVLVQCAPEPSRQTPDPTLLIH